jgi:hypothetical protein
MMLRGRRREEEEGRATQRHIGAIFTMILHLAVLNKCPYWKRHCRGPINIIQRACIKN